jgi:hypothetical protein
MQYLVDVMHVMRGLALQIRNGLFDPPGVT